MHELHVSSLAPTSAPALTSTSVERRTLSVVWGTVPCPHQRGPITGYTLRYSDGTFLVNTTGEGSRQLVLTGLTPFNNYSVQVAAVNDGGTGPYSTPLTVETLQDGEWFTIVYLNSTVYIACIMGAAACIIKVSIKRFLKRNLAHVGMVQCMNALADKVQKQDVPCTQ